MAYLRFGTLAERERLVRQPFAFLEAAVEEGAHRPQGHRMVTEERLAKLGRAPIVRGDLDVGRRDVAEHETGSRARMK